VTFVPAVPGELREMEHARLRLGAWVADSQALLQRVVPRLVEESEAVIRRTEAAERRCADLQERATALRRRLAALQAEHRALLEFRADILTRLGRLGADTSRLVLEPLRQIFNG
jgi:hypothetical protein